jgi:hypothetical protein
MNFRRNPGKLKHNVEVNRGAYQQNNSRMPVWREAQVLNLHFIGSYRQLAHAKETGFIGCGDTRLTRLNLQQPDRQSRDLPAGRVTDGPFQHRANAGCLCRPDPRKNQAQKKNSGEAKSATTVLHVQAPMLRGRAPGLWIFASLANLQVEVLPA